MSTKQASNDTHQKAKVDSYINKMSDKKKYIKSEKITFRVTPYEKYVVLKKAEAKKMNLGQYVHDKVFNPAYSTSEDLMKYNFICGKLAKIQRTYVDNYKLEPELKEIMNEIITAFLSGGINK